MLAGDGCFQGVAPAPPVEANLIIEFDPSEGSTVQYTLTGTLSVFPATELYLNHVLAYSYDPVAAGEGVLDLLVAPPLQLSQTGTIHCPPSPPPSPRGPGGGSGTGTGGTGGRLSEHHSFMCSACGAIIHTLGATALAAASGGDCMIPG